MRDAFARAIYEAAKLDPYIVVLVADISPAGAMEDFRRDFPDRFINVGIAEQAMIGVAAGLAQGGYRPFCYTIATFALMRPYEFIRDDLAYQKLPVVVVGMGAGLNYPTLGGTHMAVDDVSAALALPEVTVLLPGGPSDVAQAVKSCVERPVGVGPIYLRLGKSGETDLPNSLSPALASGSPKSTRALLTYGPLSQEVFRAAADLEVPAFRVSSLPVLGTYFDSLVNSFDDIAVIEEASGGPLFSEFASHCASLTERAPVLKSICLPRRFDHVYGTRAELLRHYGLTASKITERLRSQGW